MTWDAVPEHFKFVVLLKLLQNLSLFSVSLRKCSESKAKRHLNQSQYMNHVT